MRSSCGRELRRRMMSFVRGVFQGGGRREASHRRKGRHRLALRCGGYCREGRRGSVFKLRCRCHNHFTSGRADLTAMKTTIWRPNVRVTLDEYGEVEDTGAVVRR